MIVTKLRGDELPVDDRMRARAFWIIQRHTSLTFIQRMFELFSAFKAGYEQYAMIDRKIDGKWHRDNIDLMDYHSLALREGMSEIKKSHPAGYRNIRKGVFFAAHFESPRFGDYVPMPLRDIGWCRRSQAPTGLWAWIKRASYLGFRVYDALMAGNALPGTVEPDIHYPDSLPPMPKPRDLKVRLREEFPISGIWLPTSFPNGCPDYFVAGDPAPVAFRLSTRIEDPPMPATKWTPAEAAKTTYLYEKTETDWELLWEDRRYRGGIIPNESEYLDETTRNPPYPAHYAPPKPEVVQ